MDYSTLNLKKFSNVGSKISRKISITGSYSFGIPPAFYEEHGIKDYSYAVVFYDEQNQVIGVQFTKEKEKDSSFKLIPYGSEVKMGASFVARSFFNTHDIDIAQIKGRYDPEEHTFPDIGKVFLIDLKERKKEE